MVKGPPQPPMIPIVSCLRSMAAIPAELGQVGTTMPILELLRLALQLMALRSYLGHSLLASSLQATPIHQSPSKTAYISLNVFDSQNGSCAASTVVTSTGPCSPTPPPVCNRSLGAAPLALALVAQLPLPSLATPLHLLSPTVQTQPAAVATWKPFGSRAPLLVACQPRRLPKSSLDKTHTGYGFLAKRA